MSELGRETEREMAVAAQTGALAEMGFGPAITVSGGGASFPDMFGGLPTGQPRQMTTCLTCGALVVIDDEAPKQPVMLHHAWHRATMTEVES